jgi:hypothetical protein
LAQIVVAGALRRLLQQADADEDIDRQIAMSAKEGGPRADAQAGTGAPAGGE